MESLHKIHTLKLFEKPKKGKIEGSKWIYKRKDEKSKKDPPRYKARLEAKGFTQREMINFS